jgi:hypothetical protein
MKKLVLIVMAFLGISTGSAFATCTGPAVMHDFASTAFNMSLATNTGDGNCASNVGIIGNLPPFASAPTFNLGTLNGAATAAKQPALGTAGTPSADVITVQGASSGTPLSVSLASAVPVPSAATEATHVLKGSAGILYSLDVTIGAVSGWVMIFDATSAPADGAVTPKFCRYIKSDGTAGATSLAWVNPLSLVTGISVAFSSTGCFTKTASSTAFFEGQVQ